VEDEELDTVATERKGGENEEARVCKEEH